MEHSTAGAERPSPKANSGTAKPTYWERRKDSVYLAAAKVICAKYAGGPASVLDVGSNRTPTLEWHRTSRTRLVSVDLKRPYVAQGVESVTGDFLKYETAQPFDLVTCFQVLEHVPDAGPFARQLLALGKVVVVSVPYKWPKGRCKYHVHDPVDEAKMRAWFGRDPIDSYLAKEPISGERRLIQVYGDPELTRRQGRRRTKPTKKTAARSPFWRRVKNRLRKLLD